MEGIVDGTSNVILYGEKRLNVRLLGQNRGDDNEGWMAAWDQDTLRWSDLRPLPDRIDTGDGEWRFGSSHPSSFSVVMCDGKVKSISYRVEAADNSVLPMLIAPPAPPLPPATPSGNSTLFNRLGCRADGMPAEIQ
jgi:hypothetical protein